MEVKVGDFLLTKDKTLYRIVDISTDASGTYFDIKSYKTFVAETSKELRYLDWQYRYIRAIPRNEFRHLGKVIPQEKISKTLKILYG